MIYVGIDWAEAVHAICLVDEQGAVLVEGRVPDTLAGSREVQSLVAQYADDPAEVVVAIETEQGLLVRALRLAGYQLYAINPLLTSRYRERTRTSGAKSDPGDARMLAELVRLDRQRHRALLDDSPAVAGLGVLTRAHQELIWSRQRHANQLRSALRQYYPAALGIFRDLTAPQALVILEQAPTPAAGRRLSQQRLIRLLRRAGRQRTLAERAQEIRLALTAPQLEQPEPVARAYGEQVRALTRVIAALSEQILALEAEIAAAWQAHPDAELILSLPGIKTILGARVLAEFGDAPTRYPDSKARKCYAGTAPITRASGRMRQVRRRRATNTHLQTACYLWASNAKRVSPGARTYYWSLRDRGKSHNQAVRQLANRLVGILHGCLTHRTRYDEARAWPQLAVLDAADEPPRNQAKSCKTTGSRGGSRASLAPPA